MCQFRLGGPDSASVVLVSILGIRIVFAIAICIQKKKLFQIPVISKVRSSRAVTTELVFIKAK